MALKREINRFLIAEDPYGTVAFVRFGLERGDLRKDMDVEMIVSILDWTMERFQDALLTAELDPGLFRKQGEMPEKKEARIRQFLAVLRRAVGPLLRLWSLLAVNREESPSRILCQTKNVRSSAATEIRIQTFTQ